MKKRTEEEDYTVVVYRSVVSVMEEEAVTNGRRDTGLLLLFMYRQ